jgi:hypothetical protein
MDGVVMTEHRTITSRREVVQLLAAAVLSSGAVVSLSPVAAEVAIGRHAVQLEKGRIDMTQDLANLAPEHFEPLIGHTFTIGEHEVTLRDVHRRERTTSRFREPFSLVFSLPHEVPISSEVLSVSHPTIGQCDLLVTQVIDAAEGSALEICFS